MPFTLTRQQFYDVLWSAPMKQLRPVFGISDVMIGRIARSGQVPLPGIGYWRKVETGHTVHQEALPLPDLLTQLSFDFKGELTPEVRSVFSGEPGEADTEEEIEVLAKRLKKRMGEVAVPTVLKEFHPDIKKMAERDLRRPSFQGTVYTSSIGQRALSIANALFLKVEELGCRPSVRTDWDQFSFSLGIRFVGELKVHIDKRGESLSLGPSNAYASEGLGIGTFRDTKSVPLENRLGSIILEYATQGETTRRRWRDEENERKRHEAERRSLQQEQQRLEAEREAIRRKAEQRLARVEAARAEARDWHDSKLLREYADALVATKGPSDHAVWLRSVADEIDPLLRKGVA